MAEGTEELSEVVITAPDAEWLAAFTRRLVEDRICACGHHLVPIRAIYRWKGEIHDEPGARVALHTRSSLVPEIVRRTGVEHPDDLPAVLAFPVTGGNPEYLEWVLAETGAGAAAP